MGSWLFITKAFFLLSNLAVVVNCRKNVLFLASDDMRPELGVFYGPDFPTPIHPPMHSPNIDMLARKSLLLKRSFVQQAVCSPSRTSLLTGRRPDTTHVYDLVTYFRKVGGNYTTIPEYFKQQGYRSIGMGKIFHPGKRASGNDDPISWTEPYYHAPNLARYSTREASWRAVPKSEYEQMPLPDTQLADHAIKVLRDVAPAAKTGDKNFFVAVGFHKPHLPFVFPEEFSQYYPSSSIHIPDNEFAPVNMPQVAWSSYGELRAYKDINKLNATGQPNTSLPNEVVTNLRRAYYSAISHTDFELGRVLAELENLGLANDTIVSFWGDHGWQLGEHGEWCKHTNFEDAVHAPMMIHVPGVTDKGITTERLTEFVDLFPTLVDAAGIPQLPICPEDSTQVGLCREGSSLMPLMQDPTREWKDAVFSQYPRSPGGLKAMGYTIRTDLHRYTEWVGFSGPPSYKPEWGTSFGVELYDHEADPEENYNRADDPTYSTLRAQLSDKLRSGWRNALPPSTY